MNTAGSWYCNCSVPGFRSSSVPTVCEGKCYLIALSLSQFLACTFQQRSAYNTRLSTNPWDKSIGSAIRSLQECTYRVWGFFPGTAVSSHFLLLFLPNRRNQHQVQAGFYNKTNHLANQPSLLFALFFFLSPLLTLSMFFSPEALPFLYVFSFLSSLRSLRLSPSPSSHLFLTFALSLSLCLTLVLVRFYFTGMRSVLTLPCMKRWTSHLIPGLLCLTS